MEDTNKIYSAIVAFQATVAPVPKKSDNPFFKSKYSSLDDIWLTIRKPLTDNKLAVIQPIHTSGDSLVIDTIVIHESGQKIESSVEVSVVGRKPQEVGSLMTYYKRYALSAALGIATEEDDDGNSVNDKPSHTKKDESEIDGAKQTIAKLMSLQGIAVKDIPKTIEENYGIKAGSVLTLEQCKTIIKDLETSNNG